MIPPSTWAGYQPERRAWAFAPAGFFPPTACALPTTRCTTAAISGWRSTTRSTRVEVSHTRGRYLTQVSLGPGRAESVIDDDGRAAFTATGRVQIDLGSRTSVAASGPLSRRVGHRPRLGSAGVAFGFAPTSRLTTWTQVDGQFRDASETAYVLVNETSLEVYRGIWLTVMPQARVGGGASVPDLLRFGVGTVILPRTHFDVNINYYRERNRTSEITTQIFLAQLHLYLISATVLLVRRRLTDLAPRVRLTPCDASPAPALAHVSARRSRPSYRLLVASEAADAISHLTFGPQGLRVDRTIAGRASCPTTSTGRTASPSRPTAQSYFVTFAHGQPNGTLWRLATSDDRAARPRHARDVPRHRAGDTRRRVRLRRQLQPARRSRARRRSRSSPPTAMLEVARIPTCLMPHGSRINAQGTKHYSACMMDDTLVEIDTRTLKVARHFTVTRGRSAAHRARRWREPTATQRGARRTRRPSRRRRAARRARRPGRSRRAMAGACSWRATGRARSWRSTWRRGRSCGACRPGQVSTTSPSRTTAGACWRPTAAASRSR